jgi:osmoprotectant transport system ATP-binding protein
MTHSTAAAGKAMITIEAARKTYGSMVAVDSVSLSLEAGQVTVIVGTSGSGKSTLLRMINRLIPLTSGRILIDGQDTANLPVTELRRRIGYAIQGHGLFPHYSVADNIATVPKLLGWKPDRIRARVDELLTLFHLDPAAYGGKFPHQLSGGQQQRVGVARALAAEPELLLMDEPFGALDPVIRAKAQEDLLDIQRRFGTTIVLVTHDMDEAFHLGHKVAVMKQGRLVDFGTPADIIAHPKDPFTSALTGTLDRALKLLSLTRVTALLQPGPAAGEARLPHSFTLRDALSDFTWRGVDAASVTDETGQIIGHVTLSSLLAAGRQP